MKSDEVTSKINAAVNQAKAGKADIGALKAQLDSYNEFYQGLITYTDGVKQADSGAGELLTGSGQLAAGASELSDGADTLSSGLNTLKEGSSSLIDGVTQLKDGAMQLSDGLTEFDEKGIQKLIDALDGDLNGLITRIRATADVSKDYNSFSGIPDDMTGSVKFIYRTDSIEK
jgi:putative membrane protein